MSTFFSLYKFALYFAMLFNAGAATEASGLITDGKSKEPLSNVYVYTVKAEEETLSNDKGNFKLLSWQALPVTIVFEKNGYKSKRISLKQDEKNIRVLLEPN
ncbi:MAG: carboxypeptidase-like regulatory domain-containing protein [Rhizobacter sp.]|nr:carboxypeptidase-like regulatory domain-containing protein [Ferruginibacter sp.]